MAELDTCHLSTGGLHVAWGEFSWASVGSVGKGRLQAAQASQTWSMMSTRCLQCAPSDMMQPMQGGCRGCS